MTMITPLTEQQLDDIAAKIATYRKHPPTGFACCTAHPVADAGAALLAEVRRLRTGLGKEERLHSSTIADRDRASDAADRLAYAVAAEDVIGEHTADNSPWANAAELITSAADVDKLRAELATAIRPSTPRLCICGHSNQAHTVPAPHSCFAHGQTCPCHAYRQLPHDEAEEQFKRNLRAAEERTQKQESAVVSAEAQR